MEDLGFNPARRATSRTRRSSTTRCSRRRRCLRSRCSSSSRTTRRARSARRRRGGAAAPDPAFRRQRDHRRGRRPDPRAADHADRGSSARSTSEARAKAPSLLRSSRRIVFWFAKRMVGRVPLPLRIHALHPKIFGGLAKMEYAQDKAKRVPFDVKALASDPGRDADRVPVLNRHRVCRGQTRAESRRRSCRDSGLSTNGPASFTDDAARRAPLRGRDHGDAGRGAGRGVRVTARPLR